MLPVVEPLGRVNREDVAAVLVRTLLEIRGFFSGEEFFALELLRAFERRG